MKVKFLLLVLAAMVVIPGLPAFSNVNPVAGKYYLPSERIGNTDDFYPEILEIFKSSGPAVGTYEVHTVFNGRREIYKGRYEVLASDRVLVAAGNYTNVCPESKVEQAEDFEYTFQKTARGITFVDGDFVTKLPVANNVQASRVLSLPSCGQ